MQTFDFYRDQKCSVWERKNFRIEADTYEEALKKVLEMEENDDYDEVDCAYEIIYETLDDLSTALNYGKSTTEIYSKDKNEIIFQNGN